MKYESYTEQMNSVPLKKRFHSQSKTSPTHPEFNMTTSPTEQHSPQPTTPPTIINNTITTPPSTFNQNTLESSNDSMITTTIDNSTIILPPCSTPIKEEVKTEQLLNALLSSPTSTTIDALASLNLQSVSASNSPSNESTTTTASSSTCNSSSPEDSGSNRKEPTTSSSNNNNSSTSVTDSPNSSSKKRRQFINRANKKKDDKPGDSDSGEDSDDSENDSSEEDETLYCKCNRPASYGWMIACDRCDKWFHGRCLGLKKYQANSIGTYICPDCESTKKRKSTSSSINPSPSKSGRNNSLSRSEISASSLAKDLPPKQITNHL